MDTYDAIETNQYGMEIAKIIHSIFHLQDEGNKDLVDMMETDKQF